MIQTQPRQKKEPIENRRHSVSEFMKNPDLDVEISYCKVKLKEISMEYNNTMICEWPIVRERELYFYRELSRLQKLRKNREAAIEHLEHKKNMVILVENKPEEINDKEKQNDEDEQWEINEKNTIRQLQNNLRIS
jgi:16S rRNA C1402 (ribose-2'-O) methylase RsmI